MGTFVTILIASLIAVCIINEVLHRALLSKFIDNEFTSRMLAGLVTYIVSVVVYGFGAANGGGFRFEGLIIYVVPSLIAMGLAIKAGRDERATAALPG